MTTSKVLDQAFHNRALSAAGAKRPGHYAAGSLMWEDEVMDQRSYAVASGRCGQPNFIKRNEAGDINFQAATG
jgi:hypothetical protein